MNVRLYNVASYKFHEDQDMKRAVRANEMPNCPRTWPYPPTPTESHITQRIEVLLQLA